MEHISRKICSSSNCNSLESAEIELREALQGYTSAEIANFDESAIQVNNLGDRSFQPKGGVKQRSVNRIDSKARVTVGQPILQNGRLDHKLLIVNDGVPRKMKKEFANVDKKCFEGTQIRESQLLTTGKNDDKWYLGVRKILSSTGSSTTATLRNGIEF